MVSPEIISDCIVKTKQYGCAIATIPCAEAMMQTQDGIVSTGSYPRDNLKRTQTPQGFPIGKICDLHRRALKAGVTNSVASCTLMIEMGEQVHFSAGSEKNIKLTTVEDIDIFKALLLAKRRDWLKIGREYMGLYESETYLLDLDYMMDKMIWLKHFEGKSIFITGSTGLIGSAVADILLRYSELHNGNIKIYLAGRSRKRVTNRFSKYIFKNIVYIESMMQLTKISCRILWII